jgi:D-methionine transport system substrate-binding protein
MFKKIRNIFCIVSLFSLLACHSQDKNILRIGTISGPETQLMETAKEVAKQQFGLNIKIIEFTDYIEPNTALNDGSIDANMFQHKPFLDKQIQDRRYDLTPVAKTFVYPMGVYSQKIKTLEELPAKALVAIPNDPSNEGRALILLQSAGLILLKPDAGLFATPLDIEGNPKQLQFKELDAAQLARSLADVSIAVINTNYAIPAGLSPSKDAILHEDKDSPYANIIVVRTNEKNDVRIKQLVAAVQSAQVLKKAKELFNDQAIPAW